MGVGAEIGRGGWRDGMLSLQNQKSQMGMLEELTQFQNGFRGQGQVQVYQGQYQGMQQQSQRSVEQEILRQQQLQQYNNAALGIMPVTLGKPPSERQPQKEKKEVGTSYLKDYFVKHRELIMGFTVIVLLDHFIFEGAFRERIKKIVHSFLDKAESKLAAVEQK